MYLARKTFKLTAVMDGKSERKGKAKKKTSGEKAGDKKTSSVRMK